jgi:S-formylglutathione hydrolase FrmB
MQTKILGFLTALAITLSANAFQTCESRLWNTLGKPKEFCLASSRPLDQLNENTVAIYFFHGMTDDARTLSPNGYPKASEEFCAKNACPDYLWISFSTNKYSFFSDARGKKSGSLAFESWFVNEFMPYIEQTYGVCARRACRWATGYSMGGFGAIKTALRFPELFSRVATNSPALTPHNLYDSNEDWKEYWERQRLGTLAGMSLVKAVRLIFNSKEYADENDPFEILTKKGISKGYWPQMYFDVGSEDDFGFHEGYIKWKALLEEKQLPFRSQMFPGKRHLIVKETSRHVVNFLFGS